jgi:alpha-galactosidase
MWGSFGLVHGMRVTGDIKRSWDRFERCARELFYRNWQHGRLWINDPDCLVLSNQTDKGKANLTPDEFSFHAAAILASGGMMLSGDNYAALGDAEKSRIKHCLPPTGSAARFKNEAFEEATAELSGGRRLLFVFNWDASPRKHVLQLDRPYALSEFWSDEALGTHSSYEIAALPPHSAMVFLAKAT